MKLAGQLPKGEADGLGILTRRMLEEPHTVHAVIALIDCRKITTDTDTGDVEATPRIRRIEVIDGADLELAEKAMRRALEKRTGKTVLPIDLEDEIREAFEQIDVRDLPDDEPPTGE